MVRKAHEGGLEVLLRFSAVVVLLIEEQAQVKDDVRVARSNLFRLTQAPDGNIEVAGVEGVNGGIEKLRGLWGQRRAGLGEDGGKEKAGQNQETK